MTEKLGVIKMTENALKYAKKGSEIVAYSLLDFIKTNLEAFLGFLLDRNVLSVGIGLVVATQVNKLTTMFVDSVINPILNKVIGSKSEKLKDYVVEVFGVKFEVGNLITQFLNMMLTLFIIYLIWRISLMPNFKSIMNKINLIKGDSTGVKTVVAVTAPSAPSAPSTTQNS